MQETQTQILLIHLFWTAFWLMSFLVMAGKSIVWAGYNDKISNKYFAFAYAFGLVAMVVMHS